MHVALGRSLHDDGDGLDDGEHVRVARHRVATNAAIPAADSRRNVLAHMAGRRIVEMVEEDLTMSKILTREAFENAIRTNGAIGGSTNAVVHLLAVAGRIGCRSLPR